MQKIADLHAFIMSLNLFAAEQMDSFVDDLKIMPSCKNSEKSGEIILAEMDYTAAFFIERFPHGQVSANELFAQLSAWLIQNDTDRVLPIDVSLSLEIMDAEVADIEFGVQFNEQIIAKEDPQGAINLNGTRYSLC